jgi:hypothetical protein
MLPKRAARRNDGFGAEKLAVPVLGRASGRAYERKER